MSVSIVIAEDHALFRSGLEQLLLLGEGLEVIGEAGDGFEAVNMTVASRPDDHTVILDVGCGSGILGMLALKFGAKYSVGTDLDPCAIDATHENMEVNGISGEQYEVMIGNIIDNTEVQDKVGYEKYDIVVANILADVLIPLTPVICHQMKPGALYITSGILDVKEDVVVKAVKDAGLEVLEVTHQGEWVSVTARKQA